MPRTDLRDPSDNTDKLHPLAPFKVLAVMCHPLDRTSQHAIIKQVEAQSGLGPAKRPRVGPDVVWRQLKAATDEGKVAGDLFLYLVQLHAHHPPATLKRALALVHAALPPWENPAGEEWHRRRSEAHTSTHRPRMLAAFKTYLPVAHLWGALIIGQAGDQTIWPGSIETLPKFVNTARKLAALGARIPWRGSDRRVVFPSEVAWRFTLPRSMQERIRVVVPPLHAQQLAVL